MSHGHFIPSVKHDYRQEKWSRANWLFSYQSILISKERSIFSKCLLVKEWETRLLAPFLVGAVCVCKILSLDFWWGMHPAEEATSPMKSVCCQAEERLVSVRHEDSERAEELENQVRCFPSLQMAVSAVFSAVWGCSGTESLHLLLKETWFCRCSVPEDSMCNKKIIYSNHNNHAWNLEASNSLLRGRTTT